MRDAVVATGLEFEELSEDDAAELGCVSALQRRQRKGRLSRQEYLCYAAASGGNLKELKALRENDCLWDELTCKYTAKGRHLEVLQWAHEKGCPWDEWTFDKAAKDGHLEVLKWLLKNDCRGTILCAKSRRRWGTLRPTRTPKVRKTTTRRRRKKRPMGRPCLSVMKKRRRRRRHASTFNSKTPIPHTQSPQSQTPPSRYYPAHKENP